MKDLVLISSIAFLLRIVLIILALVHASSLMRTRWVIASSIGVSLPSSHRWCHAQGHGICILNAIVAVSAIIRVVELRAGRWNIRLENLPVVAILARGAHGVCL